MDTANIITLVTGLLAGLGIGSALTSYFQYLLKQKEAAFSGQRDELEKRYRVIIMLMYTIVDFKGNETSLRIHRPDLKDQNDCLEELRAEWYNMLLFASESTQRELHAFIRQPDVDRLIERAISMRGDLGRSDLRNSVKQLKF